ncbi:hypothetical protein C3408_14650 [Candidatus Pantoea alvi]|nr:hypothetical protein C3408_14650 [Pantoea alvi]
MILIFILILNVIFQILVIFWHLVLISARDILYAAWDWPSPGMGSLSSGRSDIRTSSYPYWVYSV